MDAGADIPAVDATVLTPVVRQLLKDPRADVMTWKHTPLTWMTIMPSGLHRFQGEATISRRSMPATVSWSAVLKVFQLPPKASDPANEHTSWNYWKREALLYKSGLLAEFPGDLRAPTFAGLTEAADGALWVWMEDVNDADSREWSLTRHALGARHLGQLNGAYLTGRTLPDIPGQSRNWLRSWVAFLADWIDANANEEFWASPIVRAAVPDREATLAFRTEADRMLGLIERLPRTFCHLDGWRQNLLATRDSDGRQRTVAIDWMFAGLGAVGEEAAGTIGGDMWHFVVEPDGARDFEAAVLKGYLQGLRDSGWTGDEGLMRFGYSAAIALRFGLLIPRWAALLDEGHRDWLERKFGRPMEVIAEGWGLMLRFVLSRHDDARRLVNSLRLA
jgi:hypothetical protein